MEAQPRVGPEASTSLVTGHLSSLLVTLHWRATGRSPRQHSFSGRGFAAQGVQSGADPLGSTIQSHGRAPDTSHRTQAEISICGDQLPVYLGSLLPLRSHTDDLGVGQYSDRHPKWIMRRF